jgi:hypothetical protein
MALWACTNCTARYSVGAPRCPQCGSTDHVEEGSQDMAPKVTVHGGPSIAGEDVVVEGENGRELVPKSEADPDKVVAEENEGGEGVSAGNSSKPSSTTPSTTRATSGPQTPSPAPKTGSRSGKGQKSTQDSSAATAGGGPADGSSETSSADA